MLKVWFCDRDLTFLVELINDNGKLHRFFFVMVELLEIWYYFSMLWNESHVQSFIEVCVWILVFQLEPDILSSSIIRLL